MFNKAGYEEKLKRYLVQEDHLNTVNSEIVGGCLKFMRIKTIKKNIEGVETDYHIAIINLQCSLTRLTREGVDFIKEKLDLHDIDEVELSLSHNQLKWIPEELFSIEKIKILVLQNNRLCYLPKDIDRLKDYLEILMLGNYEQFFGPISNRNSWRTSGNMFKIVPSAILNLSKLQHLEMRSVQLEEFPDDKIYEVLPNLKSVNIAHNNLRVVPKSNFQGRDIKVTSYDNPGGPLIPLSQRFLDICLDTGWRYCTLPFKGMEFVGNHPLGVAIGFATLWPALFMGTMYLEHGPLLWAYFGLINDTSLTLGGVYSK